MAQIIASLLLVAVLTPAQAEEPIVGNGEHTTETRKLAAFDEIEFSVPGADLRVTIGKASPLKIEADDNVLPLIKTEVHNGRLVITADKPFKTKEGVDLSVTVPNIKLAEIVGSGDFWLKGLDNKSLTLAVDGSADIRATGKTEKLTVAVAGSGDVHAFHLEAAQATVAVTGSGDVRVHAVNALIVNIVGSGDVHYAGDPKLVQTVLGSGDIKHVKKTPKKDADD